MTFEFSNHVVKYDMPTLVNCARYGMPIPDDTFVLLGQAFSEDKLQESDPGIKLMSDVNARMRG